MARLATCPSSTHAFGTDEHGVPTELRSDLLITDSIDGKRYCLDVTFTDPAAKVNIQQRRGQSPSTSRGLKLAFDDHVRSYENVCDKQRIRLVVLAFDTLGRAHLETKKMIKLLFFTRSGLRPFFTRGWSAGKVERVLSDGLHCVSSGCVLRASGAPTADRPKRAPARASCAASGA